LSEYLKFQRHPLICAEVFLSFRVLLLKFSPQHLEAFWPAIVAELVSHSFHVGQVSSTVEALYSGHFGTSHFWVIVFIIFSVVKMY